MTMTHLLDRDRVRRLFDLRSSYNAIAGGDFTDDPYPAWRRLREQAPVHEGTVHELTGYQGQASFHGLPEPDRPHFSTFSFAVCDEVYRNEELFSSSTSLGLDGDVGVGASLLTMGGNRHRRYRALVQPSFVPAKAKWWISRYIEETVQLLIDSFVDDGRAELNVDFCAAIPVLTITSSFGVPVEEALDIREALHQPAKVIQHLAPIVAARREQPQDDLISILVEAEVTDEDGVRHQLTDAEIYTFAVLLLLAGSGTTWKQMGITLTALLTRPEVLAAVREDRSLLRPAIEEAVRWTPTDPMFSRWVTEDVDFHGVHLPKGSVLHLCIGAANRDPARWDRPDEFDLHRPMKRSLGFGGGPHICLGMHVARAEMAVGIGALLDRLPNLRLDPDVAPPRLIGMYERGATEIPVLFG
ncbi:cytochrome P450 [Parafrankia sp. EUN1f]|uniref:cytochrome P450 n=1 Tax=Parafrankia sp. EUN1f TaxID=102897 RepID=UPI0001C45E91|nr:cytochrome P450 [Parafrankia sp. EUN1f]EFC82281.1 cytochrome P450 [Parafrankia sp. EUN1f]